MFTERVFFWLLLILGSHQLTSFAQDRYARFPEIGVELLQPEGFVVANKWKGLEHDATGSAIVLMTLPAPFSVTAEGLTRDRLLKEGMTLQKREEVTIAGKPALLLSLTQAKHDIEFGKWIAIFGDKTTTMIVSSYPKLLEADVKEVHKTIIINARAIEVKRAPLGSNVDFAVGASQKLQLALDSNNTLIFTADGTLPQPSPEAPLLIVSKSLGRPKITDIQEFARQRIMQTAETDVSQVERNQKIEVGQNYKACETVAVGRDKSSGSPLLIYQVIILDQDCYFIIQGLVGAQRREEFLPEFQNIAKQFRRLESRRAKTRVTKELPRRQPSSRPRLSEDPSRPLEPHRILDDRPEEARLSSHQADLRSASDPRDLQTGTVRRSELPKPKSPLPSYEYSFDDVRKSPGIGQTSGVHRASGVYFEEQAPKGGVLVGLRVVRGTDFGGSVQAIEPIFQVKDHYQGSKLYGEEGDDTHLLLAPTDYAVGGLQVGSGLWMDAVRLVYMRVKDNQLVVEEPKYSEWIGGDGGRTTEILSDGSLIVGLAGSFKENLSALELMYIASKDIRVVADAASPMRDDGSANHMRQWTSADNRVTVTARLEAFDGQKAKFTREDGRQVAVAVEKLSVEDQEYLREFHASTSDSFPEGR